MNATDESTFKGKFFAWLSRPFSVDMTAGEWFLFVGLIVVIIVLWNIILFRITDLVRTT